MFDTITMSLAAPTPACGTTLVTRPLCRVPCIPRAHAVCVAKRRGDTSRDLWRDAARAPLEGGLAFSGLCQSSIAWYTAVQKSFHIGSLWSPACARCMMKIVVMSSAGSLYQAVPYLPDVP